MMELTALETRRALEHVAAVPLKPLLEETVVSAAAAAAARNVAVRLDIQDDAVVEGDAFLLRRALSNLLDNAVDFSPAASEIVVSLERKGRKAAVQVRDRGPGIPEYAVDKVFEKFYSLARPHSRKKSTGLGLSFVREIASLHHGRVDLANAAGGGAIATLTLPLAAA
jgi:two-component system sensor histidine kinase CreC